MKHEAPPLPSLTLLNLPRRWRPACGVKTDNSPHVSASHSLVDPHPLAAEAGAQLLAVSHRGTHRRYRYPRRRAAVWRGH